MLLRHDTGEPSLRSSVSIFNGQELKPFSGKGLQQLGQGQRTWNEICKEAQDLSRWPLEKDCGGLMRPMAHRRRRMNALKPGNNQDQPQNNCLTLILFC